MDTYERLVPGDLKQIATIEAIFAYNAAMRDEMIPRKATRMNGDTLLFGAVTATPQAGAQKTRRWSRVTRRRFEKTCNEVSRLNNGHIHLHDNNQSLPVMRARLKAPADGKTCRWTE